MMILFFPQMGTLAEKNKVEGIRTQKRIKTFAMNIFQVCFISTALNETAFHLWKVIFHSKVTQTKRKKKILKRGLSSWKERKQIALDKTSTCRWFKWLFLWLVLHFNNTLEIFRFQFNVHCMCFACELLNWKMYHCSALLPSPRWFLLNTILFSCQWLLWACSNGMNKCDIWG